MGKRDRYIDEVVTCPYYRWSNPNRICCEGVEESNSTNLIFGNTLHTGEYMEVYCCSLYGMKRCQIYNMLNRKYGVKDEV